MKNSKSIFAISILFLLFLTNSKMIFSQDRIFNRLENQLSLSQVEELKNCFETIEKAKLNLISANLIEEKYAYLIEENQINKWERKITKAKQKRINAQAAYLKASVKINEIYTDFLTSAKFINSQTKEMSLSLITQSSKQLEIANENFDYFTQEIGYGSIDSKNKTINSFLYEINAIKDKAEEIQSFAFSFYLDQQSAYFSYID